MAHCSSFIFCLGESEVTENLLVMAQKQVNIADLDLASLQQVKAQIEEVSLVLFIEKKG